MAYPYITSPYQNQPKPILNIMDLLDVNVTSLSNGQVLKYNSTTGKWENSLDLNTTEAAAPIRGVQFNVGGLLTGSNNFLYTATNRLQLGTQAATSKLHISDIDGQESSISLQNLSTNGKEYRLQSTNIGDFQVKDAATGFYFTFSEGNILPGQDGLQNLGSGSFRWNDIYGQNSLINTSDKDYKVEIEESDLGLGFILDLKPISFKWKNGKRKHYGLIAQDVKSTLGEKDFAGYIYDSKSKIHGLRYAEFLSPLIKSVQEIDTKIKNNQFATVRLIQESTKDFSAEIRIRLNNIEAQIQEMNKELKKLDKIKDLEEQNSELKHAVRDSKDQFNIQIKDLKVPNLQETVTLLANLLQEQSITIVRLNEQLSETEMKYKEIYQYIGEMVTQKKPRKEIVIVKEVEPKVEEIKSADVKESETQTKTKKEKIQDKGVKNWFKKIFKNPFKKDC